MIVSGNGEKKEGDPGADAEEKNERRVGAPSQPAVVGVLCLRSSLFLVQVKYRDATKVKSFPMKTLTWIMANYQPDITMLRF